ncbi:putative 2-hydroxyacid dehydrogenase [Cyphellophora attinorum]|uniref:Putative 2-hydroxyacid dehydrogenase n=1 Tax=Cyphellophora attinorum TaxID=1664694 RepID=A0A0N1HAD3_9EURO|nr:putative 2-hydroxyacid dehydrogenase [Phialophora attinorum]KPI44906.1 putative 2-hydroxyacid dehydrogenase [Phialophora attinorum]
MEHHDLNIPTNTGKPLVVSLGAPLHARQDFLDAFSDDHDLHILPASNRTETIALLAKLISSLQGRPISALLIRMGTPPYEPFDAELLGSLVPAGCRIIASASAGYNEFDVDWMTRSGIYFCNTVNAVSEATADMAIWLILSVLRNTGNAERNARSGKWRAGLPVARDPRGLKLGIVGCGAIGRHLVRKARVFGMTVVYHNRRRLAEEVERELGLSDVAYYGELKEMLREVDVVSVNCPLNEQTKGLIGREEFEVMKDGVFLVNTARGAIVDEDAVIEALEHGKVTRAGLDVFTGEPTVNPYFLRSDKVVLQPHMGGLTDIALRDAEREAFENIRAFFRTGKPNSPVNEPVQRSE